LLLHFSDVKYTTKNNRQNIILGCFNNREGGGREKDRERERERD
jgi:hypothetical protein